MDRQTGCRPQGEEKARCSGTASEPRSSDGTGRGHHGRSTAPGRSVAVRGPIEFKEGRGATRRNRPPVIRRLDRTPFNPFV